MRFAVAAICIVAAVATVPLVAAQASSTDFIVARAGASYPAAPAGYVAATLADVRSAGFADAYNPFGLNTVSRQTATVAVPHCAVVAVQEGVLAFGPADNVSLVGPFSLATSQWESGATLTGPVQFGAAGGGFVGVMSTSFQAALYTVAESQASRCYGKTAHWAVFRPATFYFGRTGPAYPSGPASDPAAVLATLADVSARDFVTAYNAVGVAALAYPSGGAGGCCAVRVAEGYLTYTDPSTAETFFVVPHFRDSSGTSACNGGGGFVPLHGNERFATRWGSGGSYGSFLPQLDYAQLHAFNVSFNGPSACDNEPSNSFALLKSGPSNAPPSPSPSPNPSSSPLPSPSSTPRPYRGNCWKITIEGDYFFPPSSPISRCFALRDRYDMRAGTVQNLALDSYNSCNWSIAVTGFSITDYDSTHVLASVGSLTSCPGCQASNVLIPSNGSEYQRVCQVVLDKTGWCSVAVRMWEHYDCPTPASEARREP